MTNTNMNNLALLAALAAITPAPPFDRLTIHPMGDRFDYGEASWPPLGKPKRSQVLRAPPNGFDTGRKDVKIEDIRFVARDNPRAPIDADERERRNKKRKEAKRARRRG